MKRLLLVVVAAVSAFAVSGCKSAQYGDLCACDTGCKCGASCVCTEKVKCSAKCQCYVKNRSKAPVVSPETISDRRADAADPAMAPQIPWWKF